MYIFKISWFTEELVIDSFIDSLSPFSSFTNILDWAIISYFFGRVYDSLLSILSTIFIDLKGYEFFT